MVNPRQEPIPDYHLQDEVRIFTVSRAGSYRLVVSQAADQAGLVQCSLAIP